MYFDSYAMSTQATTLSIPMTRSYTLPLVCKSFAATAKLVM